MIDKKIVNFFVVRIMQYYVFLQHNRCMPSQKVSLGLRRCQTANTQVARDFITELTNLKEYNDLLPGGSALIETGNVVLHHYQKT